MASAILSDFKGVPVGVGEIWRKDGGCVVKKTSGGCFVYSDYLFLLEPHLWCGDCP